jgi:hypothetical protein
MKSLMMVMGGPLTGVAAVVFYLLLSGMAWGHCDTTGGPIIPEAKASLEKGDVTPTLKWVKKEHEAEVKTAFAKAVAVRSMGGDAKELADQYFLETLIRLHRAGEGAPYTGIKDEPVEPIVAMADKALAGGSVEDMILKISEHLGAAIRERFHKAVEAQKDKDRSVEAGREFVEAYVAYVHHVEAVQAAIMGAGGEHQAGAKEGVSPAAKHKDHRQ